jgi:hypothetical protein
MNWVITPTDVRKTSECINLITIKHGGKYHAFKLGGNPRFFGPGRQSFCGRTISPYLVANGFWPDEVKLDDVCRMCARGVELYMEITWNG